MSVVFPAEKGRFIATGPFDEDMPHYYIIIADYRWWTNAYPKADCINKVW